MDGYITDEEQVEAIKAWWVENGTSVVLGIVLGLGAIFGWRGWHAHQLAEAEAASALYQQLVTEAGGKSGESVQSTAATLLQQYPKTSYAIFTRMLLAKKAVESGDVAKAETELTAALNENSDPALKQVLRLRLAGVLGIQKKYDAALALLDQDGTNTFGPGFDEMRGDILVMKGDYDAARSAYQRALAAGREAGMDTKLLETKLDDVGSAQDS